MRKRKSQMEIMGLAIIIALLMLGMLFVIKFSVTNKEETVKKAFSDKELIANFLNAMRLTTISECKGATIEQLLIDCVNHNGRMNIRCGIDIPNPQCNGDTDSLQYFIKYRFLNETLDQWGIRYSLTFATDPEVQDIVIQLNNPDHDDNATETYMCNEANQAAGHYSKIESDLKPMPLGSGVNMFVEIKICS